jgi:hypothetical protein
VRLDTARGDKDSGRPTRDGRKRAAGE